MHRFFLPAPLPPAGAVTLDDAVAHQIVRVLRLQPGAVVALLDGSGAEVVATLAAVTPKHVTATIDRALPPLAPAPTLQLYQALIRPNRYEWLLEKATELGATSITPVISERCQVRPAELGQQRGERWRRIVSEAAEQCGRRTLPLLPEPLAFAAALDQAPGLLLLPWEEERATSPSIGAAVAAWRAGRAAGGHGGAPPTVSLFIGPEGGFSAAEAARARAHGAVAVSLGPLILRAETAALAALTLAGAALRDEAVGSGQ